MTADHALPPSSGRTLNVTMWIVQVLLALAFFAHGVLLLNPPAAIAEQMNAALPRGFWVFLGAAEVLAAIGLILPAATNIQRRLTVWAAVGIMIVMVSATIWHSVRHEYSSAATTFVLLILASAVVYVRRRDYSR